jgi:ribosomal protein L16 Arg81 hydroxylase
MACRRSGDQLTSQLEMRREGKTIEDAADPGKIYAHFRAGKTLIHGGLNLTRPNLRTLARSMTERFAAKSEIVAFLTPAGQSGAAHSDPTDVYIIQLEGTKRWQIWPTPPGRRPGDDKDSFGSLPDPVLDLPVQPGDVLYIPYGTPHRASAEASVSLHLTVVAGPRTWAHHLLSAVQDILHNGPEFWDTPYRDDTAPEEMARKSSSSSAGSARSTPQRHSSAPGGTAAPSAACSRPRSSRKWRRQTASTPIPSCWPPTAPRPSTR